jgi:hypothetical protein
MGDLLYRIAAAGLQATIWGGEVVDEENLPERGPAVLVCNHLGALGPIAVVAGIPLRLYPWVAADMLDPQHAPEYLRLDFIEKEFGAGQPLSLWLAKALAKISVPLLRSVGCVLVYADPQESLLTFTRSLDLLLRGCILLIFPEDPARQLDPQTNMRPFKKGFTRLAGLYYQASGEALCFHPLAVHAERNLIKAGRPIRFNPHAEAAGERLRMRAALESMIREMYLALGGNACAGIPLPH